MSDFTAANENQPSVQMSFPAQDKLSEYTFADETELVEQLIERARFSSNEARQIDVIARRLAHAARAGRRKFGGVDAFMTEYGLTNEEGVVLMCLAEALLRIPDRETADRLIADKIGSGDWEAHLGHSKSLFVNASTWGLMLTGRVIDLGDTPGQGIGSTLKRMVSQSGEPFIREAMRNAMRIMGNQFVMGRTIDEALKRARAQEQKGYTYSYDMLGEAARTATDAERYFTRYQEAIDKVSDAAGPLPDSSDATLYARPGLSVKLSALHPRFEPAKVERLYAELLPRLSALARQAKARGLSLTVDAEEMDRLELTLDIFQRAYIDPELEGWNGLGIAVQTYSKRALPVLDGLARLAEGTGRRMPVRLVKGAYWDTEIKHAQEQGLPGYPVFTRKSNSDVSFLASLRMVLGDPKRFYGQFASHNAHTIAACAVLAEDRTDYEFQRLHGMGQALFDEVQPKDKLGKPCRIYAPVGGHEDLLAYLVRRLLENGANTSFVNRLGDDEAPVGDIIRDPVEKMARIDVKTHPHIPLPRDIFKPHRANSEGLPLWENEVRGALLDEINATLDHNHRAGPLVSGALLSGPDEDVTSPHDRRVKLGRCVIANEEAVDKALANAHAAQVEWDRLGGPARANILELAADAYEDNKGKLMALMIREAGKTLDNALGDVREAVDFLRYYAVQARQHFGESLQLSGPTGEANQLSLHGRGVFACISPWNFPLAIFTGQLTAALAAGNAVVAKPAEQTPLTAHRAVQLLHQAGVPEEVLHLLPGPGEVVGAHLTKDPRVAGVAFTGGNDTASHIQKALAARSGPIIPLIAETGGINAMIVDSTALPEQVVRDAVRSAFDSAGQRCSALRVLVVQADVADKIIAMLTGAMEELTIGDPLDYGTDVGPVIDQGAADILNAHKAELQTNAKELIDLPLPESCANGTYVTPAAYELDRLSDLTKETFGPILHVVRYEADRLDRVCEEINATGYGLTLGLHSRIESAADEIAAKVRVGNFYVNRNQIGAVVGVQPFGGEGLSGTGPKAGGPHYLPAFAVERVRTTDLTATGGNTSLLSLSPEG